MALITVSGLTKSYGTHQVLHGIDLTVEVPAIAPEALFQHIYYGE